MKYIAALILPLLLAGCITVPVKQEFPVAPEELLKKCPELKTIEGSTTTLLKLMETIVHNYSLYHDCAATHEGFIEWYRKQREIYDSIK